MTYDPRRMILTVDKDGFTIDTQRGMRIYLDNERIIFTGDSTRDLSLPADQIVELMDNINLAYKLLIHSRTGDIEFNGQPNVRQSEIQEVHLAAGEHDES